MRHESIERRTRWLAERDAFLTTQLEPGEVVVARSGRQPLVTDRRILIGYRSTGPGRWVCDPLAFTEVVRWTLGRHHDLRPILRLEHGPRVRMELVPRRRFLRFRWGNAEGPVIHTVTTLGFGRETDPVLAAIRDALGRTGVPGGERFVIRPVGTREERIGRSRRPLRAASTLPLARLGQLRMAVDRLYRGRLTWWVRTMSWLVLAIPAWFIHPWLVVPAILVAELAWIAALRWSWRRDRDRRAAEPPGAKHEVSAS